MEIDESNIHKSEGQIRFKIEKFSEFAQAPDKTRRLSDVVFLRGLPWRILAINREFKQIKNHDYYLQCNVDNPDPDWSCAATAKLKILAQKVGKKDFVRPIKHVYDADENDWGFDKFLTFEVFLPKKIFFYIQRLMAPANGLYDEQDDAIILEADITAEAPQGIKNNMGPIIPFTNAKPNLTITVNKEAVEVNSHILTLYSTYFERNFFDNRYPPAENIELPSSTTVEDFKRMVATLPPENRKLDDDCIEAVLILADRFSVDSVLELCRNFLLRESRKLNLFKFRMAHKYGWSELKEAVLRTMRPDDFNLEKFLENAEEYAMLDNEAKAALAARHAELASDTKK